MLIPLPINLAGPSGDKSTIHAHFSSISSSSPESSPLDIPSLTSSDSRYTQFKRPPPASSISRQHHSSSATITTACPKLHTTIFSPPSADFERENMQQPRGHLTPESSVRMQPSLLDAPRHFYCAPPPHTTTITPAPLPIPAPRSPPSPPTPFFAMGGNPPTTDLFYGDEEDPTTWFTMFQRMLPLAWPETQKVIHFQNHLAPGGFAKEWYYALDPSYYTSLASVHTAFNARWPPPKRHRFS